MANELATFQERIRKTWHENDWWFSVVDVVAALTDSPSPRQYWGNLKRRIQDEGGSESLSNCLQLKMRSRDGKLYSTDAATTETVLRLIQSIPRLKSD